MPVQVGWGDTDQRSVHGPPKYWQEHHKALLKRGNQLFNRDQPFPYAPWNTVAGINPIQQNAINWLAGTATHDPVFGRASDAMGQLAKIGRGEQIFGNPYVAALANQNARALTKNFNETTLPEIMARFRQSGGSGGSAHALATGRAAQGLASEVMRANTGLFRDAYESGRNRQSQALNTILSSAPSVQQLQYNPLLMMRDAGEYLQNQDQRLLDEKTRRHNYQSGAGMADLLGYWKNILGQAPSVGSSSSGGTRVSFGLQ